jgi:hypothetical protein
MMKSFSRSDLGLLTYYVGIQVDQKERETTLCQSSYALKILEQAGIQGCNPCHVPMDNKLKPSKEDKSPPLDATKHRNVTGSLRYLVNTRPYCLLSRYCEQIHGDNKDESLGRVRN